ncbi:ejaculatory bulb-specific protein 3-like [Cloeon dipterum]|uniref:ejaculatory bulb-specific protein 3-like n=1 Tax=Cloeon dipterum TaxID=197152 RepID=UPI00322088CF
MIIAVWRGDSAQCICKLAAFFMPDARPAKKKSISKFKARRSLVVPLQITPISCFLASIKVAGSQFSVTSQSANLSLKMKAQLVLFAALVAVAFAQTYTDKFDNIDLDQILKSDRLILNYYKCLMGTGSCTADGRELKKNLPDALANDCEKCTAKQKLGTEKVLEHLIEKKADLFADLEKKYDPKGDYRKRYNANKKN